MSIQDFFDISLKKPVCIEGFSEDSIRAFINALEITVSDDKFGGFVISSNGTYVKFNFDSNGNFSGVTAKIGSKNVTLFQGVGSKELYQFKGPPSASNPGYGWKTEPELTKKYLNQPDNENNWEIFYASRTEVLNTI
jgi:hypothetical protein